MTSAVAIAVPLSAVASPWRGDACARWSLAIALCCVPLPLACAADPARAWATTTFATLSFAALLQSSSLAGVWLPPSTRLWLLFLIVPLLQLLPFAGPVAPIFGDAMAARGSLVPVRTWTRFAELAGALVLFTAVARCFDTAARGRALAAIAVALGVGLAGYGLLASQGLLPLVDEQQTRTVLVATFVNRNHTANLLLVIALLGAGLVGSLQAAGGRELPRALVFAGIAAVVAGIVGTASRGALVALVAGALCFAAIARRTAWSRNSMLLAAAAIAIAALWLVPAGFAARFGHVGEELHGSGGRPDIWRGALELWRTAPLLGTGLGTYGDLSPMTQAAAVPGRIEHAHCDPLEVLVETGCVGLLLVTAAACVFFATVMRRCRAMHDRQRSLLAAGAVSAVFAIGVHACVEFPLQMPANTMWAAAVAGLAAGLTRSGRSVVPSAFARPGLCALAALAALLGAVRIVGHDAVDGLAAIDRGRALLTSDPVAARDAAVAAVACNNFSPRAHRLHGEALLAAGEPAAAAFARSLACTNAADRPQHQLDVARTCLLAGASQLAREVLHDLLPRLPEPGLRAAIVRLHETLPAVEALLPLFAGQPPAVWTCLGEVLLQRGDFAGREAVLAATEPGREPALLTLPDGVRLTAASAQPSTTAAEGCTVSIELAFANASAASLASLVLRCDGDRAAVHRPFRIDGVTFQHAVRLDATFPPGAYAITLDFRRDVPGYPLAHVEIPNAALDLAAGDVMPATALYWSTAEPDRRARPRAGLPLRAGDVAWRDVILGSVAGDLVVETTTPTRLSVQLDGNEVPAALEAPSTVHRCALPLVRTGRLGIRATAGHEPVLARLQWTPRRGG